MPSPQERQSAGHDSPIRRRCTRRPRSRASPCNPQGSSRRSRRWSKRRRRKPICNRRDRTRPSPPRCTRHYRMGVCRNRSDRSRSSRRRRICRCRKPAGSGNPRDSSTSFRRSRTCRYRNGWGNREDRRAATRRASTRCRRTSSRPRSSRASPPANTPCRRAGHLAAASVDRESEVLRKSEIGAPASRDREHHQAGAKSDPSTAKPRPLIHPSSPFAKKVRGLPRDAPREVPPDLLRECAVPPSGCSRTRAPARRGNGNG